MCPNVMQHYVRKGNISILHRINSIFSDMYLVRRQKITNDLAIIVDINGIFGYHVKVSSIITPRKLSVLD